MINNGSQQFQNDVNIIAEGTLIKRYHRLRISNNIKLQSVKENLKMKTSQFKENQVPNKIQIDNLKNQQNVEKQIGSKHFRHQSACNAQLYIQQPKVAQIDQLQKSAQYLRDQSNKFSLQNTQKIELSPYEDTKEFDQTTVIQHNQYPPSIFSKQSQIISNFPPRKQSIDFVKSQSFIQLNLTQQQNDLNFGVEYKNETQDQKNTKSHQRYHSQPRGQSRGRINNRLLNNRIKNVTSRLSEYIGGERRQSQILSQSDYDLNSSQLSNKLNENINNYKNLMHCNARNVNLLSKQQIRQLKQNNKENQVQKCTNTQRQDEILKINFIKQAPLQLRDQLKRKPHIINYQNLKLNNYQTHDNYSNTRQQATIEKCDMGIQSMSFSQNCSEKEEIVKDQSQEKSIDQDIDESQANQGMIKFIKIIKSPPADSQFIKDGINTDKDMSCRESLRDRRQRIINEQREKCLNTIKIDRTRQHQLQETQGKYNSIGNYEEPALYIISKSQLNQQNLLSKRYQSTQRNQSTARSSQFSQTQDLNSGPISTTSLGIGVTSTTTFDNMNVYQDLSQAIKTHQRKKSAFQIQNNNSKTQNVRLGSKGRNLIQRMKIILKDD